MCVHGRIRFRYNDGIDICHAGLVCLYDNVDDENDTPRDYHLQRGGVDIRNGIGSFHMM